MEIYYPKESLTPPKMVTEVLKEIQQSPWYSEKKGCKLIIKSCFQMKSSRFAGMPLSGKCYLLNVDWV